jgi:hypothetical protein
LVESYRNEFGRVCHSTLLNIGFINFEIETLNTIRQILKNKIERSESLFSTDDLEAIKWAEIYWQQLVKSGKVDVSEQAHQKKMRMVDIDTIHNKDAREIGSEWLCYQALEQLCLKEKLASLGWDEEQIQLAITQIISRAVYPFSENRTSRWIQENSAVCEVTGYPIEKISKDKLYKSALDLHQVKDSLEQHLSNKTNELFDLHDRIILYDLSNTYFEGQKRNSKLAKFGRSKEKRSDAKLVVLAMVVNPEGFAKYSNVFEGNMSDSNSLSQIIDKIRLKTSHDKRAVVVLDAGIATTENLELLVAKGYDYVCVSRAKIKQYKIDPTGNVQNINTKNKENIRLEKVLSNNTTDYLLKVTSTGKAQKELSMKQQFETRFLLEIEKVKTSLNKKGGVKKSDKVHQRIGRAIEKYPSVARLYNIEVTTENQIAKSINLSKNEHYQAEHQNLGVYFIRTSLATKNEETIWTIYNTIREIESTFRCLKTDLDLRPIYHKNDDATMAHLHLGLLAYWLVNTVRHQLKAKNIRHSWQEIVRITNTQKIVTTTGQNTFEKIVYVRRCTEPSEKVKTLYQALGYRNFPFVKRKSVVHKSELKKTKPYYLKDFNDG